MWYIYTHLFYSAVKNNEIMLSARKNGTRDLHSKQICPIQILI